MASDLARITVTIPGDLLAQLDDVSGDLCHGASSPTVRRSRPLAQLINNFMVTKQCYRYDAIRSIQGAGNDL